MACSRLLALALAGVVDVCQSITVRANSGKSDLLTPDWIENVSHLLPMDFKPLDNRTSFYSELQHPERHTAVVTFAGKNNPEYIDGAVMLGISVQKYLPEFVRVAMIIEGMPWKSQVQLKRAGWKLVTVPNWDSEYCGKGCDQEFLGRWHDSFEKINAFRLPFWRVLFFDSDTYIFDDRIKWLLKDMKMPNKDYIAMAKDGCKEEYNSGVMYFRPSVEVFRSMLLMVTQREREQILDQNLINSYYAGKIKEINRKYNCVDTVGIQPGQTKPCLLHCAQKPVVAHFTGHPKPTSPKRRLLELVRRPGAPALACANTNFGSCGKWSEFYCDIRAHSKRLSPDLREQLKSTGVCCHPHMLTKKEKKKMARRHQGFETCYECPATLRVSSPNPNLTALGGSYVKTTIPPSRKFNGGRPIYLNLDSDVKNQPLYLFFMQERLVWSIGFDYSQNAVFGYAAMEAQCPRDTSMWAFWNGGGFTRKHMDIKGEKSGNGAPNGTEHIAWNMQTLSWEREKLVWEHGHLGEARLSGEDDAPGGGESNATASGAQERNNATESEDADVGKATVSGEGDAPGVSGDVERKNATESEGADAASGEAEGDEQL